jgi:hypothetical protein
MNTTHDRDSRPEDEPSSRQIDARGGQLEALAAADPSDAPDLAEALAAELADDLESVDAAPSGSSDDDESRDGAQDGAGGGP